VDGGRAALPGADLYGAAGAVNGPPAPSKGFYRQALWMPNSADRNVGDTAQRGQAATKRKRRNTRKEAFCVCTANRREMNRFRQILVDRNVCANSFAQGREHLLVRQGYSQTERVVLD
jgi:hypothetical protein